MREEKEDEEEGNVDNGTVPAGRCLSLVGDVPLLFFSPFF